MRLTSPAFQHAAAIPRRHTGDGEDLSPALSWSEIPARTRELALICDDPDAPTPQPWVHWVIYQIPANVTELPEGVPGGGRLDSPVTALQGKNSWSSGRTLGYRGPAPPPKHGTHHYHFRLYALDSSLKANPSLDKVALLAAMAGHVLAEAKLIGTYER
jgi:Raf kinase inhibitor-like YbhB/YbcL family protein